MIQTGRDESTNNDGVALIKLIFWEVKDLSIFSSSSIPQVFSYRFPFLFFVWGWGGGIYGLNVKCIISYHPPAYALFLSLTHFSNVSRNRHLTTDHICPGLRVYSLTRVVHHPPHKNSNNKKPTPGVCVSACGCSVGVYVPKNKQRHFHMMWRVVLLR